MFGSGEVLRVLIVERNFLCMEVEEIFNNN